MGSMGASTRGRYTFMLVPCPGSVYTQSVAGGELRQGVIRQHDVGHEGSQGVAEGSCGLHAFWWVNARPPRRSSRVMSSASFATSSTMRIRAGAASSADVSRSIIL